jgi:hypothetical protein
VRDPFVRPETVRLELSDGDWLIVKRRLSIGEIREAQALGLQFDDKLERWILDPKRTGLIDVAAYLIDWSFPVPIQHTPRLEVLAAIESLELETYLEVQRAIVAHEQGEEARRTAEKKTPRGAAASSPTSPSPGAAAGPLTTSAPSTPTNTPSSVTN